MTGFYSTKLVTARKPHKCQCLVPYRVKGMVYNHEIAKGHRYFRVAGTFEGEFSAEKICTVHMAILDACFELAEFPEEGIDTRYMRVEASENLAGIGFFRFLNLCRKHARKSRKAKT